MSAQQFRQDLAKHRDERVKQLIGATYNADAIQLAVHPARAKAMLEDYCPPELEGIRDVLGERTPTHVVLSLSQIETLLNVPDKKEAKNKKADEK